MSHRGGTDRTRGPRAMKSNYDAALRENVPIHCVRSTERLRGLATHPALFAYLTYYFIAYCLCSAIVLAIAAPRAATRTGRARRAATPDQLAVLRTARDVLRLSSARTSLIYVYRVCLLTTVLEDCLLRSY